MRLAILCLICLCLCAASSAEEPSIENQPTTATPTVAAAAKKPAVAALVKPSMKTEAELSGVTSETADNLSTRFNFSRNAKPRQFFFRAGYGLQKTRTYNARGAVSRQDVDTYTLDTQYRVDTTNRYKFFSANANIRNRTPAGSDGKSGYHSFSAGIGYKLGPGLDSEIAVASVKTYGRHEKKEVTLVEALRMKRGLTGALTLDGDVRVIRPFADSSLLDSRVNLTYKLTDFVGLRLTYIANNMLMPQTSRSGWDKSLRLSLTFSSAAK